MQQRKLKEQLDRQSCGKDMIKLFRGQNATRDRTINWSDAPMIKSCNRTHVCCLSVVYFTPASYIEYIIATCHSKLSRKIVKRAVVSLFDSTDHNLYNYTSSHTRAHGIKHILMFTHRIIDEIPFNISYEPDGLLLRTCRDPTYCVYSSNSRVRVTHTTTLQAFIMLCRNRRAILNI